MLGVTHAAGNWALQGASSGSQNLLLAMLVGIVFGELCQLRPAVCTAYFPPCDKSKAPWAKYPYCKCDKQNFIVVHWHAGACMLALSVQNRTLQLAEDNRSKASSAS